MHLEKPELQRILGNPDLQGLQMLVKLFFTPSTSSQAAGKAFIERLAERKDKGTYLRPGSRSSSDRRLSRVGASRWRTLREAPQHQTAVPRRERRLRQHDSNPKFIFSSRAFTERDAHDLSKRRSWIALSIP